MGNPGPPPWGPKIRRSTARAPNQKTPESNGTGPCTPQPPHRASQPSPRNNQGTARATLGPPNPPWHARAGTKHTHTHSDERIRTRLQNKTTTIYDVQRRIHHTVCVKNDTVYNISCRIRQMNRNESTKTLPGPPWRHPRAQRTPPGFPGEPAEAPGTSTFGHSGPPRNRPGPRTGAPRTPLGPPGDTQELKRPPPGLPLELKEPPRTSIMALQKRQTPLFGYPRPPKEPPLAPQGPSRDLPTNPQEPPRDSLISPIKNI